MSLMEQHLLRMSAAARDNHKYRLHWQGEQPSAYLSSKSSKALEGKLSRLSVNFVRLAVSALVERLTLRGFSAAGAAAGEIDKTLLKLGARTDLAARAETLHTDRALFGSAYATVWTAANGAPILLADTGASTSVISDPATGEVLEGARVWRTKDTAHAAHMTPEKVTMLAADVPAGLQLTETTDWRTVQTVDNGLQTVPIVPMIRKKSSLDSHGVSAVADVLPLSDALAKTLADAMTSSEYFARPRRWATGLEIIEDEAGQPLDPFAQSRLLQSESPETKFGQLDASSPDGQTALIATLTQQIGALTGLPAHYLGLHGDQPPSAEAVRAAETQLVAAARAEQRHLSAPWSKVAALLVAVDSGGRKHPSDLDYVTHWETPETTNPAQVADAAGKLRDIGVPLATLLSDPLGYPAEVIPDIVAESNRERIVSNLGLGG